MPVADYTYYTAAGQTAFTTAVKEGDYTYEFPLGEAEPTAMIARYKAIQTRADYVRPASPTISIIAVNGTNRDFYFVNDEGFENVRGPIIRWTRTTATVPASWREPESYPYLYPAIATTSAAAGYNVTAITASGSNFVLSTTNTTGISTGDSVFANLKFTRGGVAYQTSFFTATTNVVANTSITIGPKLAAFGTGSFSSVSGTVAKAIPARAAQKSLLVSSFVLHDYAVTNTSAIDTDLPLQQPFSPIIASTGVETTTLTASTSPSASDYATLVTSGAYIVAECSRRRYMGPIYERTTRIVPAL